MFDGEAAAAEPTLNALLALGREPARALCRALSKLLDAGGDGRARIESAVLPQAACRLHMPVVIGDYSDFYAGIYHAKAIGALMQPDNPLPKNYRWVPIGYHGRASSARLGDIGVVRPCGQQSPGSDANPVFGPSRRLDLELELGVFLGGTANVQGHRMDVAAASTRIFGVVLLNHWSARDIQSWEMFPLGPFLSKSFATTLSPWVVTADALALFRVPAMRRSPEEPQPLPYLWDATDQGAGGLDIDLQVDIQTEPMRARGVPAQTVIRSNARHLYWTPAQMAAHHSSNGCNLQPGDLIGTGTISGPTREQLSSLMELTYAGAEPYVISGEQRTFLEDGDEVSIRGRCHREGFVSIGFGACRNRILPAELSDYGS